MEQLNAGLLGGLIFLMLGNFTALWWRMGRLEGWLKRLNGMEDNPGKKRRKK